MVQPMSSWATEQSIYLSVVLLTGMTKAHIGENKIWDEQIVFLQIFGTPGHYVTLTLFNETKDFP
jgi:hypothetical protein